MAQKYSDQTYETVFLIVMLQPKLQPFCYHSDSLNKCILDQKDHRKPVNETKFAELMHAQQTCRNNSKHATPALQILHICHGIIHP